MSDSYEHSHEIRALALRMAALEDNVAFLEQWCEEQQDALDRAVGRVGCAYEIDPDPDPQGTARAQLRIVDLRDGAAPDPGDGLEGATIFAVVETEHERRVRQIRGQLNRLRTRLATTLAPRAAPAGPRPSTERPPSGRRPALRPLSAKPAGRTAP